MRTDKKRVSSTPSATSRAMARAMTMPLAPANPCRKRNARNGSMEPAKKQPVETRAKAIMPKKSGRLRPYISLKGPRKICPTAMPSSVIVKVSCVAEVEAENSAESSGSAGRYMSVASGAMADIIPRKAIKIAQLWFVIVIQHTSFLGVFP